MDFFDKANAFLQMLEDKEVAISSVDGDTAIVCNDCVAVINKAGDEIGVNFINQVQRVDYTVGFTEKDYLEYLVADEEGKDAGN